MKQKQYAASRAHVWAFCEPSEDLTRAAKNPFRRQSAEQAEGVAIHAAIHAAFDERQTVSDEMKAILEASDDAAEVVDFCVQVVSHIIQSQTDAPGLYFETVCDYEDKNLKLAARPDLVMYDAKANKLTVIDYKTGYVPVEAEGNEQLRIYAHAFCAKHNLQPGRIEGVIIQPRLSQIEYAPIHYDPGFFENLHAELKKREGRFIVGAHCKNCAALTTCKLFRETAIKYYEPHLRDGLTSRPEEWQKLIAIARPAKKFFEEILDEAKNYLEMGGALSGVGLTKSAGKRAWFREITPAEIADKIGVPVDKLIDPPKIKSPAQAEKLLKKEQKAVLRSLVYQPQNLSVNLTGETNFLSAGDGAEKIIRVSEALSHVLPGKNDKKKGKVKENGKNKTTGKKPGKTTGKK